MNIPNMGQPWLHPSMPTNERFALSRSDLCRAAMMIAKRGDLLATRFDSKPDSSHKTVIFTKNGFPVMRLLQQGEHSPMFYAATYDSPDTLDSVTTVTESSRVMYVAKSLFKNGSKAYDSLNDAKTAAIDHAHALLRMHTNQAFSFFRQGRTTEIDYKEHITSKSVGELLAVFFSEKNALDVPTQLRQEIEALRGVRDTRKNIRDLVNHAMSEMFDKPKWLVTYLPSLGYTLHEIDLSNVWRNMVYQGMRLSDVPEFDRNVFKGFYRSLEDIDNPIKDDLLSTMTLAKMHIQSKFVGVIYNAEPDDMVPACGNNKVVSPELGAACINSNSSRTMILNRPQELAA